LRQLFLSKISTEMKNLRKEAIYLYSIQMGNFIIPLLTLPYLTKTLGLVGLGKLGIAQTIFFFMGFLIDFGFTYSASKDVSLNNSNRLNLNKIYTNVQLLRFLIFCVIALISILTILQLDIAIEDRKLYLVAVLSSFSFVLIPNWLFNGLSINSVLSFSSLILKILTLFPIFFLIKDGSDYLLAFIFQNSILVILGVILSIYIGFNKKILINFKYVELNYMKKNLKDGFDVFSGSALSIVYTTLVPILVKKSLGDKWVGIYVLVEKIVSLLKQMFMPVIQAYYARICILYNENKLSEIKSIVNKVFLFYAGLTFFAIAINALFGRAIIEVFFNNQQILFKYIFISILGQFVVGLSILVLYGGILPSGNGYILKKIYAKASIFFFILIAFMWDFLTLDLIYYAVITVELMIVINASVFLINKKREGAV